MVLFPKDKDHRHISRERHEYHNFRTIFETALFKKGVWRASWKIMSILLNFTNFEISLENQKVMTRFVDNIAVKYLLYTYETLLYYCSVQNLSYSRNIRHDARNFPS